MIIELPGESKRPVWVNPMLVTYVRSKTCGSADVFMGTTYVVVMLPAEEVVRRLNCELEAVRKRRQSHES